MQQSSVHILFVEDDEDDYLIVRDLLSDIDGITFHIDWSPEYHEATQRIHPNHYDIFLIDYLLGTHTGLDFIRYVRSIQCSTPCILLTGHNDRHVDVIAGETGAADYLVKEELTTIGLERSIRYALERRKAEMEREILSEQLLETSRQLGMAEIAVNVLHNVGNVLNSINVSANQLTTLLHESLAEDIGQLATMVQAHPHDLATYLTQDPKGALIPSYLAELGKHIVAQHHTMLDEVQALTKNLDHIKHIVRAQQANTTSTNYREPVVLSELMEQALNINLNALSQHDIKIIRHFADCPPIISDRHQILQILVNLIRNAKHAMIEMAGNAHCLTLTIEESPENNRILLSVHDTGVGIHPDHLTRIFSQGFTSKKDGQGLGLHSSALAAKSLQGNLQVASDGEGQGARFTLDLPFQPVEVQVS